MLPGHVMAWSTELGASAPHMDFGAWIDFFIAFLSYLRLLFPRIARVSVGGIIACGCLLSVLLEISHAALKSLPMDTSNGNQKTELISMGNPNRS